MYKILVADDEPIERMLVMKKMQKHFPDELEVVLAENGRDALQRYEEEHCQILLLDIEMPGINGLEVAQKVRENDSESIIIFLTAFDEFSYAKKAIGVRAFDYLLKPIPEEELLTVIGEGIRILGERRQGKVSLEEQEEERILADEKDDQHRRSAIKKLILNYIEENYKKDISLQNVARELSYSDTYFCKVFKDCFDKSFVTYLTEFRISKAKGFLEDIRININELSQFVGYRDANYFAKVFKKNQGITPSEYRVEYLRNRNEGNNIVT